jgi:Bacterial PH domain
LAAGRLQLLPDERVLVDIRPHWIFLSGPAVVAAVVVAVAVVLDVGFPKSSVTVHWIEGLVAAVPCVWLGVRTARWWTSRLIVTSFRLVELWGVFTPEHAETPLASLASVRAVQPLARRMLGTGWLEIALRGEDGLRRIDDVRKPAVLQRVITRRIPPLGDEWGSGPP